MKAIQISRFGGPEVLELVDIPIPRPGPNEVLVRVAAAGINFAETLMREDRYVASYAVPAVPGSEFTGTIVELGEGVGDFSVGQRIGAVLPAVRKLTGGYAEYAVADVRAIAALPDGLDFDIATALLVQGLTALYLAREIQLARRSVLITAAGGGVGSLLIQLARHEGATKIIAAASNAEKRALALSLGADEAIGYDQIAGCSADIIYDSVGGDLLQPCLAALASKGVLVAYGSLNLRAFSLGIPELGRMVFANQSLRGFAFGPLLQESDIRQDLAELFELVLSGALKPSIGSRFSLAEAGEAHRALSRRQTKGKLLLIP